MAKDYGIAPWVVESECSMEWLRNWLAYRTAEAQEERRLMDKAEREAKRARRGR